MKRIIPIALLSCALSTLHAQQLATYKDSLSYAVGIIWGQNILQQGLTEIDPDLVATAIRDLLQENAQRLDMRQANEIVKHHITQKQEQLKQKNLEEGRKFLAENAKRPEVKVTPSGLQYEIIKQGDGPIPKSSDKVRVHYTGTLIDGTVFDSSVQRGEPLVFPVTGVIKGWVEALQMMPVGSKWKLYIPAELAYGERGAGPKIGPNATLIFEVELLGIEDSND
ncbi:MAG: peptidyl-prolyl cis-trans isomerase [Saprospiraceae bacterium]|nr:MAG: peptidyl-prolyl cis-trans isomerase [Saprospiraceae bacterium]